VTGVSNNYPITILPTDKKEIEDERIYGAYKTPLS
jgi:hypothetical protein